MSKIGFISAALYVAIAFPAYATNGMRMIGFGAVQNSMGGASVGATLDGASMVSNPAGLTELGRRLDLGGELFKPSVSYNATGIAPPFVANNGATLDSGRGPSPIPALSVVAPITDRLSAGIGIFGTSGMGVDYPVNLFSGATYTSYMQARLTPSVAYKLKDMVSAGVTINGMLAFMKYDVARGVPFNQVTHDTTSSFGVGATLGVKVRPATAFAVGAAYETKSWFQDFAFKVPNGTDKLTFNQPQSAAVGVEVTPIDILLLAGDVQWINWSDTMGKGLPRYSANNGAIPWNMNWSDQWVFKVGAQVAPFSSLRVRAGYDYGKMPLDPSRAFENLAFPAVAEHHITAGLGYDMSRSLTLNVAGMYALNAKLSGANAAPPNPDGSGGQGITAYTTQMSQFELDAGVAYRF